MHREALLRDQPEAFAVTPDDQDYPMVIVRLGAVEWELLRALLKEAWRMCASPRLLKAQAQASVDALARAVKPRARRAARPLGHSSIHTVGSGHAASFHRRVGQNREVQAGGSAAAANRLVPSSSHF